MEYSEKIILKNGKEALLRNGIASDGKAVFDNFNLTHDQTDFLLSYSDENSFNSEQEGQFLEKKTKSENEIELIAIVDGKVAGTAGIEAVGTIYKVRHRAEFGISIDKEYWGLGIGSALLNACIKCARKAGYIQLELDAVAANARAISLYKKLGFIEYGRNPKGFNSRHSGFQEIVYMSLDLKKDENKGGLVIYKGRPDSNKGRLEKEIRTYDLLDDLKIEYERVDHEAANTMEACEEIDKALSPAVICKNLFLCNSQKTKFYLLMIREDKKFLTKEISHQIGSARLSFAPPEFMEKYFDITPGSVSVMGLMNDHDNNVQLLVDEDILKEKYFGCHPCINTSSLRLKTGDVFGKFLKKISHDYIVVKLGENVEA